MQDIDPIAVAAGDQIQLTYNETLELPRFLGLGTRKIAQKPRVLMSDSFTEARVIDRIAIVDLGDGELKTLGMSQGIAGVFGKRS